MRLIDADELMEHVSRDRLDSRDLIARMIENAPTVSIGYKPCPWCNGAASLKMDAIRGYNGNFRYYVQCDTCKSIAPNGEWQDIYISSEEAKIHAVEAWNKRGPNFKN